MIREFILRSFATLFERSKELPIDTLLQTFLKCLKTQEIATFFMVPYDFRFCEILAKNPRMTPKVAREVFSEFSNVFLKNMVQSKSAFDVMNS